MKHNIALLLPFFLALWLGGMLLPATSAFTSSTSVPPLPITPTYDPFREPTLPPNPTELDQGRYLYWHHCMPCHGDQGQGLTAEFRALWDPEHQNCWGKGCHSGQWREDSFPIPTQVPALVGNGSMPPFTSLTELTAFLKNTHPPQSPGSLKDEEYRALAIYVFALNRPSLTPTATLPALTPTPGGIPFPGVFPCLGLLMSLGLASIRFFAPKS